MVLGFAVSQAFCTVIGFTYPAFMSYKALRTETNEDDQQWLMYWVVFSLFVCLEQVLDVVLPWIPLYYELKIAFVIWLMAPYPFQGAKFLFLKFVKPVLDEHELALDTYFVTLSDKAKSAFEDLAKGGGGGGAQKVD